MQAAERGRAVPLQGSHSDMEADIKLLSRLLALGIAATAIAACEPPPRDVVYRAPAHYTPTDQRVLMAVKLRQSGELSAH